MQPRSFLVSLVGVINILLAVLLFAAGVIVMVAATIVLDFLLGPQHQLRTDPNLQHIFAFITGMSVVAGSCVGCSGLLPLLAGIGVLRRRQYGRILSLLLALMALAATAGDLKNQHFGDALVHGGYAVLVGYGMLSSRHAAEFT